MGVMYSVYGLRLSPNSVVRLTADKNFYLQLTVEKMHAFIVFNDKYLRSDDCKDTSFTLQLNVQIQKLKSK